MSDFADNFRKARISSGYNLTELARLSGMSRSVLSRIESGTAMPRFDDAVRLAQAMHVPLEMLANGRWRPNGDLRSLAMELHHLGIRDMIFAGAPTPGALRRTEEVLVLALQGERPDPRIVEAIPFVLATVRFSPMRLAAFSKGMTPKLSGRLAWLCEIALILAETNTFSGGLADERQLAATIRRGVKSPEPDSLGHPRARDDAPPAWKRWNITYAGNLKDFRERTAQLEVARSRSPALTGDVP